MVDIKEGRFLYGTMKTKWVLISGTIIIVILLILGWLTGNVSIVIGGLIGVCGSFFASIANLLGKEIETRNQLRRDIMRATFDLVKIRHELKEKYPTLTEKELDFEDLKKAYIEIYNQFMKELSKE